MTGKPNRMAGLSFGRFTKAPPTNSPATFAFGPYLALMPTQWLSRFRSSHLILAILIRLYRWGGNGACRHRAGTTSRVHLVVSPHEEADALTP